MKILIILIVAMCLAAPSSGFAIQKFQKTGEIKKDESGGYDETQRDPHSRRAKQIKDKTGGGYYEGGYHSKSPSYQQGEWQFVDSAKGGSSKHHKKGKGSKKEKKTKSEKKK